MADIITVGRQIVWYRGFEVRLEARGVVELFTRELHGKSDPLSLHRRQILSTKGKPDPEKIAEHVRQRINAYWFEFEHRTFRGERLLESCVAIDGLPWEIHRIHHHVARDAATRAFTFEHEVKIASHVIMGYNALDWAPFDQYVTAGATATLTFPTGTILEPSYSR